jgi:hypothetical protein
LPKSRSREIASGKNGLSSVAEVPAVAKPKFRYWHHGRLNWLDAGASFLKRIYSNRAILPLPRQYRAGPGATTRDRNNVAGAGNSPTMSPR